MRVSGNNSRYKLYDLIAHKETTFHTSDIKPFVFDPAVTDPVDVARRDHIEFFVEAILGTEVTLNVNLHLSSTLNG
jgi:hypothetical protein